MKKLEFLVIHCSATPEGEFITAEQIYRAHLGPCDLAGGRVSWDGKTYDSRAHLPDISFHGRKLRSIVGRGWKQVGYSDIVHTDGSLQNLVPYDWDDTVQPREQTNGALGINEKARHVVYIGGIDKNGKAKDTRTDLQKQRLRDYVLGTIALHQEIKVAGHNQFAAKACPSFWVPTWAESIGVLKANIHHEKFKP
jgi:N-acetylmuramoyl-L-alanine amidase